MPKILSMELKDKLRQLCDSRKWGRYALMDIVADVSDSTIDNWWNGKSRPNLEAALAIAREFRVPMEWLADDEQEQPPETELPPDEAALLRQYRNLKETDMMDEARATAGLAIAARLPIGPDGRPILTDDNPKHLGRANLTESFQRREAEANRPKPPPSKPQPDAQPPGKDVRPRNGDDPPPRKRGSR